MVLRVSKRDRLAERASAGSPDRAAPRRPSAVYQFNDCTRLLPEFFATRCPIPGPGQHFAVPIKHQTLVVWPFRRIVKDSRPDFAEGVHTNRFTMGNKERGGSDDRVLDVLNALDADGFVVHCYATAWDPPNLDPGLARSALGATYPTSVEAGGKVYECCHSSIEPRCLHGRKTSDGIPQADPLSVL